MRCTRRSNPSICESAPSARSRRAANWPSGQAALLSIMVLLHNLDAELPVLDPVVANQTNGLVVGIDPLLRLQVEALLLAEISFTIFPVVDIQFNDIIRTVSDERGGHGFLSERRHLGRVPSHVTARIDVPGKIID